MVDGRKQDCYSDLDYVMVGSSYGEAIVKKW